MIKVLIVDDSATTRHFLEQVFNADPALRVIGQARDGAEAIEMVERLAPDVITMDICMPGLSGLEATARIMEEHPTPIVILSGNLDDDEVMSSCRAMEAGALVALAKPSGGGHPDHGTAVAELVQTVKLMSEVRVVKRWIRSKKVLPQVFSQAADATLPGNPKLVAVGASTGGPVVINTLLAGLTPDFPLPILIVQHMAAGFIRGFAEWLGISSGLPVHIAAAGEIMLPGHAYIAPDGCQTMVANDNRIAMVTGVAEYGHCPSVAALFRSVAMVHGGQAIGILLTGMGSDGARELKMMKDKGAVTIAQDQASSVIYGMPGEAAKLGAATYLLPPDKMAAMLERLAVGSKR